MIRRVGQGKRMDCIGQDENVEEGKKHSVKDGIKCRQEKGCEDVRM